MPWVRLRAGGLLVLAKVTEWMPGEVVGPSELLTGGPQEGLGPGGGGGLVLWWPFRCLEWRMGCEFSPRRSQCVPRPLGSHCSDLLDRAANEVYRPSCSDLLCTRAFDWAGRESFRCSAPALPSIGITQLTVCFPSSLELT